MRLTSEELLELTNHLASVLKRKRFSVKTNPHGIILYVEKFGIRSCPAILNSLEDGKQGYAYIQLVTNPYSEKDLGSYYKPRTNKTTHKMFEINDCVDKYSGKDVHIDMHNYKQVIDTFVNDLNKDYYRIINTNEDIEFTSESGTCKYVIDPTYAHLGMGWWIISDDNHELKYEILKCIDDLANHSISDFLGLEGVGLTKSEVIGSENLRYFDEYAMSSCTWKISDLYRDHIYIILIKPNGISYDTPRTISRDSGAYKVLSVINDWVNKHRNSSTENLKESVVKIKDTGTVFDGMTGTVEQDDGDKLTVLVDFNDEHKVMNRFKKEQIEILED